MGGSVLFGAHPAESDASVDRALAAARELDGSFPDGLGLAWAAGGRVYANSPLGRWVAANLEEAGPHLYGKRTYGFTAPLVYCHPGTPRELFARVTAGLASCRGQMHALNIESVLEPRALRAERDLNQAFIAAAAGQAQAAVRACRAVLRRAPEHTAALETLGLVQANQLGDSAAALATFRRLLPLVSGVWAREVGRVIGVLQG